MSFLLPAFWLGRGPGEDAHVVRMTPPQEVRRRTRKPDCIGSNPSSALPACVSFGQVLKLPVPQFPPARTHASLAGLFSNEMR